MDSIIPSTSNGRFATLVVCMCIALTACGKRQTQQSELRLEAKEPKSYPGPPTVTMLLLQYENDVFTLLDASSRRDTILPLDIEAHLSSISARDEALFEYRLYSPTTRILQAGVFVVALKGEAAYEPPGSGHRVVHERSVIKKSSFPLVVPFSPETVGIEIYRLTPVRSVKIEEWSRTLVGKFQVPNKATR